MAREKKVEIPPAGAPAWMATFSDLVTLLMCFFVLLYAMSNIDQGKFNAMAAAFSGTPLESILEGGSGDGIMDLMGLGIMEMPEPNENISNAPEQSQVVEEITKEKLQEMAATFNAYIEENSLQEDVKVEITDKYMKISFSDSILFESGKADVKQNAVEVLKAVASVFMTYPRTNIRVEGHADDRPINYPYKNNWYLSSARAIEVGTFFINNGYVESSNIEVMGFGDTHPIADNSTPEGRAKNRRVELKIVTSGR